MPETRKPSIHRSARRLRRAAVAAVVLAAPVALLAAGVANVTPATGPSLIAKLKTGVDWTAFGRAGGGDATAVAGAEGEAAAPAGSRWLVDGFELTGADLYRMNCRSCHGPAGQGARSGIPPIVGALAKGAPGEPVGEVRVRHRLVDGGRVMPVFSHLQADEVTLLLGHLRALGGEPGNDATLREAAVRVGEHVVKANCQICHDAVAGPERQPADTGVIPLSEMTARFSVAELVRKVRTGSPEIVRDARHGRMPRIDYLTPEELEAAYVYLVGFPPQAEAH